MPKIKVMITSGGTQEKIDDVRYITNISTGKLGAIIAEHFSEDPDVEVHYVYAKNAEKPPLLTAQGKKQTIGYKITDVASLYKVMKEVVPQMDIVIHAMAVSDFGFDPINEKLKSSDAEAFIESMRKRIKTNPKILPLIKQWNSKCKLVSFKFEVGLSHEELISIAKKSMESGNSDIVIANDKTEMVNNRAHIAYAIDQKGNEFKFTSKEQIATFLYVELL